MNVASKTLTEHYASDVFFALKNLYAWKDLWSEDAQLFHMEILDFIKTCELGSKYNFYQSPWDCSLRMVSNDYRNHRHIPQIRVVSEKANPNDEHQMQYELANNTLKTLYNEYTTLLKRTMDKKSWDYTIAPRDIARHLYTTSKQQIWDVSFVNDVFESRKDYWMPFLSKPGHVSLLVNNSTLEYTHIAMFLRNLASSLNHSHLLNSYRYQRVCTAHCLMLFLNTEFPTYPSILRGLSPLDFDSLYESPEINLVLACQYGDSSALTYNVETLQWDRMASLLESEFELHVPIDIFLDHLQTISKPAALSLIVFMLDDKDSKYQGRLLDYLNRHIELKQFVESAQQQYHVLTTLVSPDQRVKLLFEFSKTLSTISLESPQLLLEI